jgi:demethylmenaquinone methyltransferase/2-methoxy-6-polyprenyl-1,4-benzoquinol methylase
MFSAIAPRYDLLNRVLSLGMDTGWRNKAARDLRVPRESRFLDVCGGTGDLAEAFLRVHPDAEAVLLDFSVPMLYRARVKFPDLSGRLQITAGDALRLPFDDGRFDALGCAFGIRNLADRSRGFREFHRVLKPGGSIRILEFTPRGRGLIGGVVRWYVGRAVPFLGGLLSRNPGAYTYLSRSIGAFPKAPEVARMMNDAGFASVTWRDLSFGACTEFRGIRPNPPGDAETANP